LILIIYASFMTISLRSQVPVTSFTFLSRLHIMHLSVQPRAHLIGRNPRLQITSSCQRKQRLTFSPSSNNHYASTSTQIYYSNTHNTYAIPPTNLCPFHLLGHMQRLNASDFLKKDPPRQVYGVPVKGPPRRLTAVRHVRLPRGPRHRLETQ